MPEGTGSFVETALIKVDLEGGNLTLDLGADDNDTLILASGSSIDLGGGVLTISDGTVDVLTNAADFSNVSNRSNQLCNKIIVFGLF